MSNTNTALTPSDSAFSVIPFTFKDNNINASWEKDNIVLSINGPDLIITTGDGRKLILTMGAELASFHGGVLSLAFNDGKKLTSYDILSLAHVEETSPNIIETNVPEHNVTKDDEQNAHSTEDKTVDVTTNMTDNFVVIDSSGGADMSTADVESSLDEMMNIDMEITLNKLKSPNSTIMLKKSSTSSSSSDSSNYESNIDGVAPIVKPQSSENLAPEPPKVKLYQWEGLIDGAQHVVKVGSGNLAARTTDGASEQYSNTVVDLSTENANWTIDVTNRNYIQEGKILRIISFDDAQTIDSITGLPQGYEIIKGGTPQGDKYGLLPNEAILLYPENQINKFGVNVTYTDKNGVTKTENFNFSIVESPSSIVDMDGNLLLSSKPNNVHVIGGAGDDVIIASNSKDIYDGGAGVNTVDYSKVKGDLIFDLNANMVSGAANQELKNIQNIVGNDGNNTFIGDLNTDNKLIGGAGNDVFIVGGGNANYIDGKEGINTLSYETTAKGINVDLTKGSVTDSMGRNDTVKNINNITGTHFDDILKGDDKDNIIIGNGGNDTLIGMGGNNTLIGGNGGNVTASYEYATNGIVVNLANSVEQVEANGFGGKDTLKNIQTIIGSNYDDLFVTANGSMTIYGGAGNDIFKINGDTTSRAVIHGESGNNIYIAGKGYNTYIGGMDNDTVDYSLATSAININLKTQRAYSNGFGGTDQLVGINGIIATNFDDHLTLNDNTDYKISTGNGNDYIIVGKGSMNNHYDGGVGIDTLDYSNVSSNIDVSLQNNIANKNGSEQNGKYGQDIIENIENIVGSAFDDVIEGNAENNKITLGGGFNNIIYGSLGNDEIIAKAGGTNTLDYSRYSNNVGQGDGIKVDAVNGKVIKVINGQQYEDTFTNNAFTKFVGTANNDIFLLDKSTTLINGNGGKDTIILSNTMTGRYMIDLENQIITGSSKVSMNSITNVMLMTSGSAEINGNKSIGNRIIGGSQHDHIRANGGDNIIDGGGGDDWIFYDSGNQGVIVTLDENGNGTATNGFGGHDKISRINHIRGSQYDDALTGKGLLVGGAGNNKLTGVGSDAVVDYSSVRTGQGVVANLETGKVSNNGYNGVDSLNNIYSIIGTDNSDIIYGSHLDDQIYTRDGNDIVYGSAGNDKIVNGHNAASGTTTLDYHLISEAIKVDMSAGKVHKGNLGDDQIYFIANIIGTNQNDDFQFKSLSDLTKYKLIDGGLGNDAVSKAKGVGSGIFDFTTFDNSLFRHIDVFNFKDNVNGDFIIVNIDDLFKNMDNNNIQFDTDSADSLQILDSMGTWVHTEVAAGIDQWTDGTHTLTWNHV